MKKFPHQLLLFGYGNKKEVFYANNFAFKGYYATAEIPFEDITKSYYNILHEYDMIRMNIGKGKTLLHLKAKCAYKFDKDLVRDQLVKYVCEKEINIPMHILGASSFYGQKICEVLNNILNLMKQGLYSLDVRLFGVLYDHKKLMHERITYMIHIILYPNLLILL